jgi:hypothetical protein
MADATIPGVIHQQRRDGRRFVRLLMVEWSFPGARVRKPRPAEGVRTLALEYRQPGGEDA